MASSQLLHRGRAPLRELGSAGDDDQVDHARPSPKMLEYNADTPTSLVEAAVAQWYWLQDCFPETRPVQFAARTAGGVVEGTAPNTCLGGASTSARWTMRKTG